MFDREFYPTPSDLAFKMARKLNINRESIVLEPSAGNGILIECLLKVSDYYKIDVDAIEIDPELRSILKGKEIRVVHDDFLTFDSLKRYDAIIMNPPFSDGDKHLVKALSLLKPGGRCVCLLNSSTLNNPYSNLRKTVKDQLEDWDASIEIIPNAFAAADRKTNVEIAFVYVQRPKTTEQFSLILDNLQKDELNDVQSVSISANPLIDADPIRAAIIRCRLEQKAGLKLLDEYKILKSYLMEISPDQYSLHCGDVFQIHVTPNEYIKMIRRKYWEMLFKLPAFNKQMTSSMLSELHSELFRFEDYDFSDYNITALRYELSQKIVANIEKEIISLFDEFSRQYSYTNEFSKNIHYYNGWKTNKAWKINKKIILPLQPYTNWNSLRYEFGQKMRNIDRALAFLDGGKSTFQEANDIIEKAVKSGITKNIDLGYITIDIFKKGTVHIRFNDDKILQRFNIFGSQHKNWLPPSYGKKQYTELDPNEKEVIDSFEGEISYQNVCNNPDLILSTNKLALQLNYDAA
ncbi:MAG: DUF4942 domain-containing protein [Planctomycetaceae bacterium]|jgi:hypothetical protein|nr:DUF4942 domain-containing protein [Planctomycetaceae bacterium]